MLLGFLDFDKRRQAVYEEMVSMLMDAISEEASIIIERKDPYTNPDQVWGRSDGTLASAKEIYAKAKDLAVNTQRAFSRFMKLVATHNAKVLLSIKKEDSFLDKVVKRKKPSDQIHDVLRGAILASTKEDVEEIVRKIKRNAKVFEAEYKDKEATNEYGYYGSWHFKIYIQDKGQPVGIIAEIQVMTKRLWAYKYEAHQIYDRYRSAKEFDDTVRQKDIEWSRQLFKMGNR